MRPCRGSKAALLICQTFNRLKLSISELDCAVWVRRKSNRPSPSLTPEERKALQETLEALEEGVSVEEWRAMNAALDEELNDPSPTIPADQVFAEMETRFGPNAA